MGPMVYLGRPFVLPFPGHSPATWWSRGGCGVSARSDLVGEL